MLYRFEYTNYDDYISSQTIESDEDLSYPNINNFIAQMIKEKVDNVSDEFVSKIINGDGDISGMEIFLHSKGYNYESMTPYEKGQVLVKNSAYSKWNEEVNLSLVDYLLEKGIATKVIEVNDVDIDNPLFLY